MAHPRFAAEEFVAAALEIAAEGGPAAATVASVTARLRAPVGSFYHRFASRDVLLGEVWLRIVEEFRAGFPPLAGADDGLKAALYTPAWARANLAKSRLLLLHHRDDFVAGEWPEPLRERVASQARAVEAGAVHHARAIFGAAGPAELRRAQFLVAELPLALVGQHLRRGEPPPALVDELIAVTYRAVLEDYRSRPQSRR